jgi:hypothetical protein
MALVIFVPLALLVWAIQSWWSASPRIAKPAWRSYVALGAIFCGGLSLAMWVISVLRARAIGGFFIDDTTLVILIRIGFLAGALGFFTGLLGKGTFKWPAFSVCAAMTLLWIATGISV